MTANLEHLNLTVTNPDATAAALCELFDWQIRWSGPALNDGYTVHVGSRESYLALYTHDERAALSRSHTSIGNLNHIGVLVDDLDKLEQRVTNAGYRSFNHGDYQPGTRFYFHIEDEIEVEVVSYASKPLADNDRKSLADNDRKPLADKDRKPLADKEPRTTNAGELLPVANRAQLAMLNSYLPFANK